MRTAVATHEANTSLCRLSEVSCTEASITNPRESSAAIGVSYS